MIVSTHPAVRLADFRLGMSVTRTRFAGRVVQLTPTGLWVRWESNILEFFEERDLDREGGLWPVIPRRR